MAIVAAIDQDEKAQQVVSEAWKLANQFDETLHVLFVYDNNRYSSLTTENITIEGRHRPDDDEVQTVAEDIAAEATAGVTDEYEAVGRRGRPAEEIVSYTDEVDASYIAVGGRRRSPAGKALFRSVTQSVLLDTDRPVLVVTAE